MFSIRGVIQPYDWGSADGIAGVLGTPAPGGPQAEYWLGAHPKGPATDPAGTTLDALIAASPEWLGERSLERFGQRLPFLMKLLSADRALSLQAHPSREQAEEGYAREDADGLPLDAPHRNYRDDWPKPEALVALTEFHGLCGFREPDRTARLVGALGVPAADDLFAPVGDNDGIARVFLEALALADEDLIDDVVTAARPHASQDSEFGLFCRTPVELAEHYPGDPGILAALLLNRIMLAPGEAFFMPAGNMHAYLHGTGLEVMAASDNVLRGGLTPKHVDIDELARVVDFRPGLPAPVVAEPHAPGVRRYTIPAPEFALYELSGHADLPETGGARILLVVEGSATITAGGVQSRVTRGDSVFLPAGEDAGISGGVRAFLVAAGG